MQTISIVKHIQLTLAKDRTAIIDGCTAALDEVPTAARAANRDAVVRTAEENISVDDILD